jgi:hypothetical protein
MGGDLLSVGGSIGLSSEGDSLHGRVISAEVSVVREQGPDDSGVLVGQRNGCHVWVTSHE